MNEQEKIAPLIIRILEQAAISCYKETSKRPVAWIITEATHERLKNILRPLTPFKVPDEDIAQVSYLLNIPVEVQNSNSLATIGMRSAYGDVLVALA